LHWPCPTADHPGTPILHGQQFTRGLGKFHAIEWIPPAEQVDDEYPIYLTTGRVIYQYHTGTMTMKSADLNNRAPESYVEVSRRDAEKFGIHDGDMVTIASRRGSIEVRAKILSKAVDGTVFIPFHFAKSAANQLTNAALDPVSGIPEFKVCAVKIDKAA
jgi:formate dehydrogenase major subunit